MRIKRKEILIALFPVLMLFGFALLFLFVPAGGVKTASAAETTKYTMYFDYEYYNGVYLSALKNPSKESKNVLKSESLNCTRNLNVKCELEFHIYGSSYGTATDVLAQGGTIKSNEINIESNSKYDANRYEIKDSSGSVVASNSAKSIRATLSNGTYYVTFTGEAEWVYEGPIRDNPRALRIVCTFFFKVDSHTHSYTTTVTKPTCTTDGYTTYRCSCGHSYTDNPTSALGHSYSATTTPPTCTSGGYTTNRCTRCGNTYQSNQSDALGHSYDSTTTPPTCTEEGYTTHVCSRCNTTYVDSRIPALGHSYTVETSATCTGEKFVYTCSRCQYSYTDYTDENGTGHSFTTKTTAATCTEEGYTIYTCTKCGYNYRDTVSRALGHNYTAKVVSPKCTEGGYTLYTCSRCGDEYRSGTTEASGHNYVERTFPATCTEGSYTLHECSRCGDSYRDNVSQPLGHNYETSEEPPTCTEGGKTVYLCQVCGHRREDSDGSLPTGHSYTSIVLTPATCTTNGQRQMTCENCGYGYVETIRARGHNYGERKNHKALCLPNLRRQLYARTW